MDKKNDQQKKYYYFTGIVMLITLFLEFILNIVFIGIAGNINGSHTNNGNTQEYIAVYSLGELQNVYIRENKYDIQNEIFSTQYKSISAIFSLFFIAFIFFIVAFIITCKNKFNMPENYDSFFHILFLVIFYICQFLYFMYCVIIPIYFQRVKKLLSEENTEENKNLHKDYNIIVRDYRALASVCYVFLFIILFFNFTILNLYKKICCNMERICLQTENCCKNFLLLVIEKMTSICEQKTKEIKNLENLGNERDIKITNLNVEISNLMAQNIEISIKKAGI